MKNIVKRVLSFMMVLMLVVMAVPVSVDAAGIGPNSSKGTITITGVNSTDSFNAYEIIDITYDSGSNSTTYTWKNGIESCICTALGTSWNKNSISVEEFAKLAQELRNKALAAVAGLIENSNDDTYRYLGEQRGDDNTFENADTDTEKDTTIKWKDVELGAYIIIPTSATDVYQIMFAVIKPSFADDEDSTTAYDYSASMKKTPAGIEKNANDETTGDSKIITYTIWADIPTYGPGALEKTYKIADTLDSKLKLENNAISEFEISFYYENRDEAKINGVAQKVDNSYKATSTINTNSFSIDFDYDKISIYDTVKI